MKHNHLAVIEQALDFCEFAWRDVPMNDYAFERLEQTIATLRDALAEPQEPVEATQYNLRRIAWELERTALGDGFYGNALRVAKDIPGIRLEDRSMLDRYATGTQTGTDHVHLQWLVQALYNTDDSKNGVQT